MKDVKLYQSINDQGELTDCITQYSRLVKRIALQIKHTIPEQLALDDLMQAGFLGLLEAKKSYSPMYGASLHTYATIKIRYAIYDFLRKNSGISREVSQYIKRVSQAVSHIENNESVTPATVAETLGVTKEQYHHMLVDINASKTLSLDELTHEIAGNNHATDPILQTARLRIKQALKKAIQDLPKRDQFILALYYNECLSFREIGDILKLTEARISQRHTELIPKLRGRLASIKDSLAVDSENFLI